MATTLAAAMSNMSRNSKIYGGMLGGSFVGGLAVSLLLPSGCIFPDYCIMIRTSGRDFCRHIEGAMMWPVGQPEAAEPIFAQFGDPPRGCKCFNAAEQQILSDKYPEAKYQMLIAELIEPARNACHLLVPPGYDHSCYDTEGPNAPTFTFATSGELSQDCFGSCSYFNPPPNQACPEDPTPWECNADNGVGDSGGDDIGDPVVPPFDPSDEIACKQDTCQIDADFARALWLDPERLLADEARLVFEAKTQRFVLTVVHPGSVAHALALRSGDILESINGLTIEFCLRARAPHAPPAKPTVQSMARAMTSFWISEVPS